MTLGCRVCSHARRDELELEGAAALLAPSPDLELLRVAEAYHVPPVALAAHLRGHRRGVLDRAVAPLEPTPPMDTRPRCRPCSSARRPEIERAAEAFATLDPEAIDEVAGRFNLSAASLAIHLDRHTAGRFQLALPPSVIGPPPWRAIVAALQPFPEALAVLERLNRQPGAWATAEPASGIRPSLAKAHRTPNAARRRETG